MEFVKDFDVAVLLWLNQFSQISPAFDEEIFLLTANEFFKGGLFMAAFWFWWWRKEVTKNRQIVISAFVSSILTFLFTYEMAQLFNHLRSIFSFLKVIF